MIDDRAAFAAVAEAGSFARAARALGVSRSTVMRRVDALEASLGVPLLQRAGRRVALTEAGRRYAEGLRPVMRALERLDQDLLDAAGALSGTLRIWLPALGTSAYVAPSLAAFQRAHPGVVVQLELGRELRRLELGGFDVALLMGLRSNPALRVRTLFRERMILVASPDYLERFGVPASVEDLRRHRGVHHQESGGRVAAWRRPDGSRIEMAPAAAVVNAAGFAFALAKGGVGVTSAPSLLAEPEIRAGALVRVLPEIWHEDPVSFVFPPDPGPVLRAFLDFSAEWFRAATRDQPEETPR